MVQMTPRERVMAALNHQEPDRVPLDIGGGTSTTLVIEGYDRLKAEWGIPGETRVMNKAFRLARLDEAVMARLGSDTRPLTVKGPANWTPPEAPHGYFIDFWGVTWRQAFYGDGCYYWELCGNPLADATIEDLETYPWPDVLDPGFTAGLQEEAKALYYGTDYAILADGGFKSFWELAYAMRGLERLLTDLVLNPGFVEALMEKLLELNLRGTGKFLDLAGPYIQVLRAADDLATQTGCMFSPKSYRTLLKPYYKRYLDFVKSRTDAKIFYHSCGNVAGFIDDLAEIGVDALNPVQVTALGDTAALKARFGAKVSFWGAIDTQRVLPLGTPEEVEEEVRLRIRTLGPGGGFVAASVHNFQPDVPTANIVAMANAVKKWGRYPLRA
jgi:uroporphyrinogen decarboxylase